MLRRFLVLGAVAVTAFVGLPAISGCDGGNEARVDHDLLDDEAENLKGKEKMEREKANMPKGAGENK